MPNNITLTRYQPELLTIFKYHMPLKKQRFNIFLISTFSREPMFMQSLAHLHTYIPVTTLSLLILSLFRGFQTKKTPKADVGFEFILHVSASFLHI